MGLDKIKDPSCVSIHVVVGLLHFRRGDATDLLESLSSQHSVGLWEF